MKVASLIYVEVNDGKTNQSNKYYKMTEIGGSTFNAEWGRVGCSSPSTKTYPMYDWDKVYKSKIKKGYKDVTSLRAENKIVQKLMNVSKEVEDFFSLIQSYSSNSVKDNYILSSKDVTPQMILEAQRIVDELSKRIKTRSGINDLLLELYKVIPRKMRDVRDHLISNNWDEKRIEKLIVSEQDTLDSMAGQVLAQNVDSEGSGGLLEALGLSIEHVSDSKEIDRVKNMMGDKSRHFYRLFKVTNKKTKDKYDLFKERVNNEQLLWHGSRNQNWYNIIQTGLLIRPSGAIYTGSMFGDATYFSNMCRKAMNYTSLSGSYWAKGSDNRAFMALFNAKLGKQKHIYKHDHSCYSLNWDKINKEGFDSVYAHGGADLINDEFCAYRTDQCTIKYIVELRS